MESTINMLDNMVANAEAELSSFHNTEGILTNIYKRINNLENKLNEEQSKNKLLEKRLNIVEKQNEQYLMGIIGQYDLAEIVELIHEVGDWAGDGLDITNNDEIELLEKRLNIVEEQNKQYLIYINELQERSHLLEDSVEEIYNVCNDTTKENIKIVKEEPKNDNYDEKIKELFDITNILFKRDEELWVRFYQILPQIESLFSPNDDGLTGHGLCMGYGNILTKKTTNARNNRNEPFGPENIDFNVKNINYYNKKFQLKLIYGSKINPIEFAKGLKIIEKYKNFGYGSTYDKHEQTILQKYNKYPYEINKELDEAYTLIYNSFMESPYEEPSCHGNEPVNATLWNMDDFSYTNVP